MQLLFFFLPLQGSCFSRSISFLLLPYLNTFPHPEPPHLSRHQGDTISGSVDREDVAQCVAAAATSKVLPKAVTFELYSIGSSGPLEGKYPRTSGFEQRGDTYDAMFKGLKSDVYAIE